MRFFSGRSYYIETDESVEASGSSFEDLQTSKMGLDLEIKVIHRQFHQISTIGMAVAVL